MYTANLFEYRFLKPTDDLGQIGRLLFQTDPFIYPAFFGTEENAVKIMAKAVEKQLYCFNYDNIFCALDGNRPVAMVCTNPGGIFKWDLQQWTELFTECGVEITDVFRNVAENYFGPMNRDKLDGYTYILAVCVSDEMRGRQIGRQLMAQFLQHKSQETIILDTLADNPAAVGLYRKNGFEDFEYYTGYSTSRPYPSCIRMIRRPSL